MTSSGGSEPALTPPPGEQLLLAGIVPRLPVGDDTLLGPGDDAAVVAAPDGRVVVTTDVLVEGRHFRRRWADARDIGYRAAVANLADVAAMGARPTALVVAIVCPPDVDGDWLQEFADGLREACQDASTGAGSVGVVGGDLSSGTELSVAITALGDLGGREPVRRAGARDGDVLAYSGVRGRSAAGLALLQAGRIDGYEPQLVGYRRPVAPTVAGIAAGVAGATAMLDVSDGLLIDAQRIAQASGVRLDIDTPTRVFARDLAALAPAAEVLGLDPQTWVLTGGEDHGLLATFPPEVALPHEFHPIGRVHAGPVGTVSVAGHQPQGTLGWDHFA